MQYMPCNHALLAQEALFLTQKGTVFAKDLQTVCKLREILIRDKIVYFRASNFRLSPNFSAPRPRASAQLLPPWNIYIQWILSIPDMQYLSLYKEHQKCEKFATKKGKIGQNRATFS